MELLGVAEKTVKRCEEVGFDEAEAYVQRRKNVEIVLERGEIQSERIKTRQGLGIRLIKDKKVGFAHTSVLKEETVDKLCKEALGLVNASISNPEWISLPTKKCCYRKPSGIYDEDIEVLGSGDFLSLVIEACDAVEEVDKRVHIDDGKLVASTFEVAIANSHGISLRERGTAISFFLVCIARENGSASSFAYEYDISRTLKGFSPGRVGELAAKKALASLNPKSIESFEGEVLLSPDVAAEILFTPVINSINADNVQRGRSVWADRINWEVASSNLSLIDDGLLPNGINSFPFDAEGVPSQRTLIIDKGVLKAFIYDSYTANKEGVESTGNASRSDYSTPPSVSISNLIVEEGRGKFEDLIQDVERGIVINRFSGNVNPQSGDFSGLAKQASYIENGEVKFPLKETMISGNSFTALKNIIDIGEEKRATFTGVYTPPILIKDLKIVSKH